MPVPWAVEWRRGVETQDEDSPARRSLPPVAPTAALTAAFVWLRVRVLGQSFFHNSLQQRLKESPHRVVSFLKSLLPEVKEFGRMFLHGVSSK